MHTEYFYKFSVLLNPNCGIEQSELVLFEMLLLFRSIRVHLCELKYTEGLIDRYLV
jgi:hypothetical protein